MSPVVQPLAAAAERFKRAKAELVACGLPPDVIDAALRPLWHSVRLTQEHYAREGKSAG